jgi:hypothetical protein
MGNLNNNNINVNVNVNAMGTHRILKANVKGNWCSKRYR